MNMPKPLSITPDMTVLDILSACGETERVFKRHDAVAGECLCCHALFDTLSTVSKRYGIHLDALIKELEAVQHP